MTDDQNPAHPDQPRRAEGPLELRVWGASQEQLAAGIEAARAVLERRGTTAGRAIVSHSAVSAYELDPTLPVPDAETIACAEACREAYVAAVTTAGGDVDGDEDALAFDQGADGRPLWNVIPTLRAYRARIHGEAVKASSHAVPPMG